jgi:D-arabinose 1-dehydrogenase-like Zn-dependent alcohol dehydrogenase
MKAAVVTDFTAPLQVKDVPVPEPAPDEVLVRIEASGLCHTDIHAAHGDWPVKPTPPFIPGHEGVGRIEKLGQDVTSRAVGQRVAIARIAGAFVIAVDVEDHKLELATRLGADHVVNAAREDPVEAIQRLGGADVAVALAASSASFDQAFHSLRRGGRLVCVALPADGTIQLPIFDTVLKGISVIGSIVGTRNDLADVFALHAAGRTEVVAVERKLDEVNESIADVLAGRVPARIVFGP